MTVKISDKNLFAKTLLYLFGTTASLMAVVALSFGGAAMFFSSSLALSVVWVMLALIFINILLGQQNFVPSVWRTIKFNGIYVKFLFVLAALFYLSKSSNGHVLLALQLGSLISFTVLSSMGKKTIEEFKKVALKSK